MRLKSFFGTNMTEAMRNVREALGDEAIIVATRDDEMGGVRVTAAIDEPLSVEETIVAPIIEESVSDATEDSIDLIAEALSGHKVPNSIAEKLLASATQFANEDPLVSLGAALEMHFTFDPISLGKEKKSIALIGPPGAGKTLCTSKLATQATLAKTPITVISTDTERAGGMEQLAAFTRILEISLLEIEDSHALQDAISIQETGSLIIIDTAGCNPFDPNDKLKLGTLLKAADAEPVIVMPADMDAYEAIDLAKEYQSLGAKQLIPTRLDMTRRIGGLLRTAHETNLTLCHYSASSKVSEQPQLLNPVSLGRLILPQGANIDQKATGTYE